MLPATLTALHAASVLGAVAFWSAAMYLWALRTYSTRRIARNQVAIRFVVALAFTAAAWALRLAAEYLAQV